MGMKFLEDEIVLKYYNSRQLKPTLATKLSTNLHYRYLDMCCNYGGFGYRVIYENSFGIVSCFQLFNNYGSKFLCVCTPFGYYRIDLEVY